MRSSASASWMTSSASSRTTVDAGAAASLAAARALARAASSTAFARAWVVVGDGMFLTAHAIEDALDNEPVGGEHVALYLEDQHEAALLFGRLGA